MRTRNQRSLQFVAYCGLALHFVLAQSNAVPAAETAKPARGPHVAPSPEEASTLRDRVNRMLIEQVMGKWYPRTVNRQRGGFHQNLARDWTPLPDQNCFLVYQARMTWTAAAFAEFSPADREEYLEYARHGVEFLDRVMRDREQGGFHWILDAQGNLSSQLGTDKHVYATAFVVYAGSRAYEVTRDPRALQVARDAFEWLEQCAHDSQYGGYHEGLGRDGTPQLAWDPSASLAERYDRMSVYRGFKSMNAHIHLLEALAELHRVDPQPLVRERLEETLAIVRDRIAVEPGALNLYLTRDWRAVPAHDSFGHDVETTYLLLEAAESLGGEEDERTWHVARQLTDHALDWGWDEKYGGFYDKGEAFRPAFERDKIWWTQFEGLNTLLLLHHRLGHETDRYWQAFLKQWHFIEHYQVDTQYGGVFEHVAEDGTLTSAGQKASQWKAAYHTARSLMNVSRLLQQWTLADSR